ncbi:putative calmodulin-binding domain containing protein [Tanacetum coccineum]
MNTLSEETPRVKSSSSSAGSSGKKREHSNIDITSSGKSSTGYCHDFCNYGKHHEHVKSAISINSKRTTVVDKEEVAKIVVPVEKKKTTTVAKVNPSADPKFPKPAEPVKVTKKDAALPSQKAQVMKYLMMVYHDATAGSNNVIKEIASKLTESRKSKVKALANAFETVISASKLTESRKSKVKALVKAFETVISASKLVQSWKSKVKALVDAFETVISLQDGKPSST